MDKPRRLGRGLEFLLPTMTPMASAATAPIEFIRPNRWQPRTQFDDVDLDELAESIRVVGIIQPIAVRRMADGKFELIAGERRLRAAQRAGLVEVPILEMTLGDQQMLVAAIIENVQRRDLAPLERARAFQRLSKEQGLSHEQIAAATGLARPTVSNSIRLLDLDAESIAALESGQITEGHARALLSESDSLIRSKLLSSIVLNKFNVRSAELGSLATSATSSSSVGEKTADALQLEKLLSQSLGAKVRITERGGKGRIIVAFRSLEQFDQLFERMAGQPPPVE